MSKQSTRTKLQTIKHRLSEAEIPWLIFAGAAAYAYGCPRPLTDLDIIVRETDYNRTRQLLKDIEDLDILARLDIPTDQGTCHYHVDDEMIGRTQHRPLLGLTVPVIPVEDNIILKAILQLGEDQGKHDIQDIECMIENQTIDLDYLKRRIRLIKAELRVKPLLRTMILDLDN